VTVTITQEDSVAAEGKAYPELEMTISVIEGVAGTAMDVRCLVFVM
jgi:hypothetical protein